MLRFGDDVMPIPSPDMVLLRESLPMSDVESNPIDDRSEGVDWAELVPLFCVLVCGLVGRACVSEVVSQAAGEVGVLYILDVLF